MPIKQAISTIKMMTKGIEATTNTILKNQITKSGSLRYVTITMKANMDKRKMTAKMNLGISLFMFFHMRFETQKEKERILRGGFWFMDIYQIQSCFISIANLSNLIQAAFSSRGMKSKSSSLMPVFGAHHFLPSGSQ